jgi:uncharacterized protein YukE
MKKLLIVAAVFGAALIGYGSLRTTETTERESAEQEDVSEPEGSVDDARRSARPAVKRERSDPGGALRPDDGVRADPDKVREGLMKMLGQGGQESTPEPTAEATQQAAPVASKLEVAVQARQAAADKGELSHVENRVLGMYERMGRAFEENASDCTKMGETVLAIVNEDRQSLSALTASWNGLSPEQRGSEQERIEKVMGEGVETLRQSFRSGLAKCAANEDLKSALRVLADASEPLAAAE